MATKPKKIIVRIPNLACSFGEWSSAEYLQSLAPGPKLTPPWGSQVLHRENFRENFQYRLALGHTASLPKNMVQSYPI